MDNLTCREARWMMSLALDAVLTDTDDQCLKRHLATCSNCAERWEELGRLVDDLEKAPLVAPPVDFVARVMAGTRSVAPPRVISPHRGRSFVMAAILLGAVCVGLVSLGGVVFGLFNLVSLASAADLVNWIISLSAALVLPRALLDAVRDIIRAMLAWPWPAMASGASALSICLVLVWVYVVLNWRGVPLGQLVKSGNSDDETVIGR